MNSRNEQAALLYRLASQDRLAFRTLNANPGIDLRIARFYGQQRSRRRSRGVDQLRHHLFPSTHDLSKLADLLRAGSSALPVPVEKLHKLNPYAVAFRYDDHEIHTLTRDKADDLVERVFAWAADQFG